MGEFVTTFFMTIFNKSKDEVKGLLTGLDPDYYVIGEETCPSTLKQHIHVYARLKKKRRFSAMGKLFGCHVEDIKKHPQTKEPMHYESMQYCKKDGNWIEFGTAPQPKVIDIKPCPFVACIDLARSGNLDKIREEFPKMYVIHLTKWKSISSDEQCKEVFLNRKCLWIYGKSGIGKSRWVSKNFPEAYRKNAEETHFERYRNEKVVVIEDIMPSHRKDWLYNMLMCSDIYAFMPKVRYGSVCLKHEILIVTSNYKIEEVFPFDDSRGGVSPWQRRFIELEAIAWAENEDDLLIKVGTSIFYQSLLGFLLTHYFIVI